MTQRRRHGFRSIRQCTKCHILGKIYDVRHGMCKNCYMKVWRLENKERTSTILANALVVHKKKESRSSVWACAHTVMTIEDMVAERITENTKRLIRGFQITIRVKE